MEKIIKAPLIVDEFVMFRPTFSGKQNTQIDNLSQENVLIDGMLQTEKKLVADLTAGNSSANNFSAYLKNEYFDVEQEELPVTSLLTGSSFNLQEVEEKAINDGFAKGYEQGLNEASSEYSELLELFNQLLVEGRNSISSLSKDTEVLIGSIVFESVCKILGQLVVTKEGCESAVMEVIKQVKQSDILSIKVSPRDFKLLGEFKSNVTANFEGLDNDVVFEPSSNIELGGCVLKLKDGYIDGSIKTQLAIFSESIKNVIRSE